MKKNSLRLCMLNVLIANSLLFVAACRDQDVAITQQPEQSISVQSSPDSATPLSQPKSANLQLTEITLAEEDKAVNYDRYHQENAPLLNTETKKENPLPGLFEAKQADKAISINGKPTFGFGDAVTDVPEVNGGEVQIDINF